MITVNPERLVAHVRLLANLLGFDLVPLAPVTDRQTPITSAPGFDGRAAVGMNLENLGGCK